MNLNYTFLIALALSLDAFGVSISIGINKALIIKDKILFAISFGFFQFFCSLLGACLGFIFNTYITAIPNIIGGGIIVVVGIIMIKDGFENKDKKLHLNKIVYIILGISVSIDAFVIGFTGFNNIINFTEVFLQTIFIGLITLIVASIAFIISAYLSKINVIAKYADFMGGIILIFFGIKMMVFF
jgi:putative Mn2+ efflux pump MntP